MLIKSVLECKVHELEVLFNPDELWIKETDDEEHLFDVRIKDGTLYKLETYGSNDVFLTRGVKIVKLSRADFALIQIF